MDKGKRIVIVGAGGIGREIQWYLERIISKTKQWQFIGYVDNGRQKDECINGYPVLGGNEFLLECEEEMAVICAIGHPGVRKELVDMYKSNSNLYFPNIIDPDAKVSERVEMGEGNVICPGVIITVNVTMGDFNLLNLNCTVGHDAVLSSFITINPNTNVSGNVCIGPLSDIGTGCQIIQAMSIGERTVAGAGSVIVRDVPGNCTVVGCPARVIKTN